LSVNASLSLTPAEEFMFHDDRPAYPWSFFVRLRFSGCTDQAATEDAFRATVKRHPLTSATVVAGPGNSLWWQSRPDVDPAVQWLTSATERPFPLASRLDLRSNIGVRLLGHASEDASKLYFQFHHACCDGKGAFQFVGDWLSEYARRTCSEMSTACKVRSLDESRLKSRQRYGLSMAQRMAELPRQLLGLSRTWRFLTQTAVPLVPGPEPLDPGTQPDRFPTALSHCFGKDQTAAILATAGEHRVTVNDLLISNLLIAFSAWRARHNIGSRHERLRLMIPVNMRTKYHDNMSAANVTSLVFVTRRGRDCSDAERLLRSVHQEMMVVKRGRLAGAFLRGLRIRRRLPGGLLAATRGQKCMVTTILTNLGPVLEDSRLPRDDDRIVAGNVVLQNADFLAPIRPLTQASFAVSTYAGRLGMNLQYDCRALSDEQARELFGVYLEQFEPNRQATPPPA
jgi:NRPS condensation-like uncharacterized protein